ncbi:MAG: FliM/FliN family flagellar motor switch protein [Gammaproteobacteria bacterium]|nr:FliM/FliN family flagellar motor switch protein [Gammaproteobacteria bacterium]
MDPKEIISDEESAALREAPAAGDPAGTGLTPAGQVQDLHADHWERILADRAPALESIAERMVSLLKVTGRRFFRTQVDVVAHPVRSVRWGVYARQLPAPTSLNVLDVRPAGLKGVVTLGADFVFTLVDVFFGGDGKGERSEELVEFTPMEQRLTRKFVDALTSDLKQAWKPFLELDFACVKSETNPIFAAVAASAETVSVARFAFMIGEREHAFEVVLPAALVEPLRSMREAGQTEATAGTAQKWRNRLREDMQEARVGLRAVLTGSAINLRDIALARPGDVIHTDLPATVVLYAGDQPLLEGTFGVSQGRNAIRISKPVNRRILGEKHG